MKVKELRKLLKNLPANMDIVVNTGISDETIPGRYTYITLPVRKARTKLIKKVGNYTLVQSRPHRDEDATLSLVIE
jgi:hypothetical protein